MGSNFWSSEEVAKAVERSRSEKKLLMVFIEGKDDQSKKMSEMLGGLSEVIVETIKREMVCVRVERESDNCSRFSEIYPVVIVPSIYFITIDGVNLEVIPGVVDQENFNQRIQKILSAHKVYIENKNSKASTSPESSSISASNPANPESSKPSTSVESNSDRKEFEDKVAKAKQLLEQVKMKMKKEEMEKSHKSEKERIESGKAIQAAKSQREQIEAENAIKEKEKEKREAMEARERILAQIAADKEERRRRNEELKGVFARKVQAQEDAPQKTVKSDENSTRIQFRLPDGTVLTQTFKSDEQLQVLSDYVSNNSTCRNFTLSTTYPKRIFESNDMPKSLRDLLLVPSAVILVLTNVGPSKKVGAPLVSANFFSQVWGFLFATFIAVWGFVLGFFRSSQSGSSAPDAATLLSERKRAAEEREKRFVRRRMEIGRPFSNTDGDDDNNTWNGNSTQQM